MFALLNLVLGLSGIAFLAFTIAIKEPYEWKKLKGDKGPYPHEYFNELRNYKRITGWICVVSGVLFLIMFGQEY